MKTRLLLGAALAAFGSIPPTPDDMLEGYNDGRNPDSPEPSANRSDSYRHGFQNGRDDLRNQPRAGARELRRQGDEAIAKDKARWTR